MKRRLPEDAGSAPASTSISFGPSDKLLAARCALPLVSPTAAAHPARPAWACLAQELGPTRLLAAVVCVHSLAVVSLQVVDKALAATAAGMATVQASAAAAATALLAAHLRDPRCVASRRAPAARRDPPSL
jgi:hypothetical protein